MDLTSFIWDRLPYYYHLNDTYKDSNGLGILGRFCLALGVELQTELIVKLEGLINELDPATASDEFLSLIAYSLGNPTDILGDTNSYRVRLMQAITLYRVKGTEKSYQLLFALLGYSVQVNPVFPSESLYDIGLEYDDDTVEDMGIYDADICVVGCVEYSLTYSPIPGRTSGPLTSNQLSLLTSTIIKDLQPLDGKLTEIIYSA